MNKLIKHILLSLLMLCNIRLAYGKATTQLKPIDIINNPNILTDQWLTEPIPIPGTSIELPQVWNKLLEKNSSNARVLTQEEFYKEFGRYEKK